MNTTLSIGVVQPMFYQALTAIENNDVFSKEHVRDLNFSVATFLKRFGDFANAIGDVTLAQYVMQDWLLGTDIDFMTGDTPPVKAGFFSSLWDGVKSAWNSVTSTISDGYQAVTNWVTSTPVYKNVLKPVFNFVTKPIVAAYNNPWIQKNIVQPVVKVATAIYDNTLGQVVKLVTPLLSKNTPAAKEKAIEQSGISDADKLKMAKALKDKQAADEIQAKKDLQEKKNLEEQRLIQEKRDRDEAELRRQQQQQNTGQSQGNQQPYPQQPYQPTQPDINSGMIGTAASTFYPGANTDFNSPGSAVSSVNVGSDGTRMAVASTSSSAAADMMSGITYDFLSNAEVIDPATGLPINSLEPEYDTEHDYETASDWNPLHSMREVDVS